MVIDNSGNLQLAAISTTAGSTGVSSSVLNVASSVGAVRVSNNVLSLTLNADPTTMGLMPNVSKITLLGFTFATFLNGLTLTVVGNDTSTVSLTFVHPDYTSGINNEGNATVRVGFSEAATVPTYDGTIVWQSLGSNYLNSPAKWIQVVDTSNAVTGEVANWDVAHQMGLLAPRTDLVWEIGGGDTFNSYEIE
jgi:hypothetical protein